MIRGIVPGPPGQGLVYVFLVPIVVGTLHLVVSLSSVISPTIHALWNIGTLGAIPVLALVVSRRRALYGPVHWWWYYAAWLVDWRTLFGLWAGEFLGRKMRREQPIPSDYQPTDFADGLIFWPGYLLRHGNPFTTAWDLIHRYTFGKPLPPIADEPERFVKPSPSLGDQEPPEPEEVEQEPHGVTDLFHGW